MHSLPQSIRDLLYNTDHIVCPSRLSSDTVWDLRLRTRWDRVILSITDCRVVGLHNLERFAILLSQSIQCRSEIVERSRSSIKGVEAEAEDIPDWLVELWGYTVHPLMASTACAVSS